MVWDRGSFTSSYSETTDTITDEQVEKARKVVIESNPEESHERLLSMLGLSA